MSTMWHVIVTLIRSQSYLTLAAQRSYEAKNFQAVFFVFMCSVHRVATGSGWTCWRLHPGGRWAAVLSAQDPREEGQSVVKLCELCCGRRTVLQVRRYSLGIVVPAVERRVADGCRREGCRLRSERESLLQVIADVSRLAACFSCVRWSRALVNG